MGNIWRDSGHSRVPLPPHNTTGKIKEGAENNGNVVTSADLSDYREVNGIKFPFERKADFGGQVIDFKAKEIKVNSNIPETDFK